MKRSMLFMIPFLAVFMMANEGCDSNSAELDMQKKTQKLMKEANNQIGMPNIVNFTERKFAKMILELRDEEMTTYSYFMDMYGNLHFLCNSIGYGLNASVQYTNPDKVSRASSGGYAVLPQADPNGLYMPQGLSATYVLCVGKDKQVHPVYSEPNLIVSPFKLKASSSLQ